MRENKKKQIRFVTHFRIHPSREEGANLLVQIILLPLALEECSAAMPSSLRFSRQTLLLCLVVWVKQYCILQLSSCHT